MPIIYLSPSTQEYNSYYNGGTEEEWMNRLADAMEPILEASGIQYVRNTPAMTAYTSIRASNAGNYDFHLALHSNASGAGQEGSQRGIIAFYYPGSADGQWAAQLIADGLKEIYPLPDLVKTEPTTSIGEVRRVSAPAVLLELGYHDNPQDADWIVQNLEPVAESIVRSLTKYFGIPFFASSTPTHGVVQVNWGYLNIRSKPDTNAPVVARAYDGADVTVLNSYDGWYLIRFGDVVGYASANFIELQ